MIWVDYCIIAVTLVSVVIGIVRGFTKEVFGIVTWVAALLFAWLCSDSVIGLLHMKISSPALSAAVGYAVTFLLGLLIGAVISTLVVETIRNSRFSSADRTLGGGFGLIRAFLLVGMFIMIAGNMGARGERWWEQSAVVPHLEWLANGLQILVPESWLDKVRPDEQKSDQPKNAKPER